MYSSPWALITTRSTDWSSGSTPGPPRIRHASVYVQRGTSVRPKTCASDEYVAYDDLIESMTTSTVVVTHGGPATIMAAHAHGRLPVVVPRRPDLGEHVDDHQIRFGHWMANRCQVVLAETEDELPPSARPRVRQSRGSEDRSGRPRHRGVGQTIHQPDRRPPRTAQPNMTEAGRTEQRPTVLYIGGLGRSGGALLERMLGQVDGVVAVGEIVHLIERGLVGDEDCGCGRPFHQCPFWTDVGAKAFGGWDRVVGQRLVGAEGTSRPEPIHSVDGRDDPAGLSRDLLQHAERLQRLYEAIAEVSGADVIVDSSKHTSTAFLLRRVGGIRLRILHLVHDSRGGRLFVDEVSRSARDPDRTDI